MRILFTITVLCVLVLLWAGLAIRRHVLAAAREREERRERPQTAIAFEAELQTELRMAHAETGFFGSISDPQPGRSFRPPLRESALRSVAAVPAPSPRPEKTIESSGPGTQTSPNGSRKPPVSIGGAKLERLDWAHFNKDLGDLSDPYQVPRTAARNRS